MPLPACWAQPRSLDVLGESWTRDTAETRRRRWVCGASLQIKMKVKKSSSDKVRETNRADLLRFLNSSYD